MSFCKMETNARGVYKRCSSFIEVALKKSDLYNEVVSKVFDTLKLDGEVLEFCLVRLSGAVVPDENISFGKISSLWTIGRYLNKLHTSADRLQLGIAFKESNWKSNNV